MSSVMLKMKLRRKLHSTMMVLLEMLKLVGNSFVLVTKQYVQTGKHADISYGVLIK